MASAFSIESFTTTGLWQEDLSYPDLAEDVAVEARLALSGTEEIHELDERIQVHVSEVSGVVLRYPVRGGERRHCG